MLFLLRLIAIRHVVIIQVTFVIRSQEEEKWQRGGKRDFQLQALTNEGQRQSSKLLQARN